MAKLRYRKSIRLPGGVRVNVSSKGVGYSWGVPGARITRRADGRTTYTGSLRGTGLSVQQTLGRSSPRTRPPPPSTQSHTVMHTPDYWTGFIANMFIPGLGMAHIQAPGWALLWAAVAILGAFLVHPFVYVLAAAGSLFHYRALYSQGRFVPVPIQVSGIALTPASSAVPAQAAAISTGAGQATPISPAIGSAPIQTSASPGTLPRRFKHGGLPPFVLTTGSSSLIVGVSIPANFPDPGREAEANFHLPAGVMRLGDRHLTSISMASFAPQGGADRFRRFVLATGGEISDQGFRIRDVKFWLEDHCIYIQYPPEYDILDQFPTLAHDNVCLESIHQSGNGVLLTVAGWNNLHPNRRQNFQQKWTFLNLQVNGTLACEFSGDLPANDFLKQHTRCILRTGEQIFPLYFGQQTHRQPQPDGPFEVWINTTHLSTTWTVFKFDQAAGLFGYGVSRLQPGWLPA